MLELIERLATLIKMPVIDIGEIVRHVTDRRERHCRQIQEALEELRQAAILTRAYLGEVSLLGTQAFEGNRSAFTPQMRRDLAQIWLHASRAIGEITGRRDSRIDELLRDFEERCFDKAQYWANPAGWNASTAEIKLDSLVEEIRTVLTVLRGGG
jgi:hypothetical protein